jgi:DHA2 family multidrug resistance protein
LNAPAAAAGPAPLTGAALWGATLLLSLANFMVVLDTTIANVSVPHIAGGLAVSPTQGTWVITSYSVAEAITVPLTGWLAQRFGPVKVFAAGMIGFATCSMLCGLAPSFGMLVMFRVMQGLCGGPLMPTSQTLLLHIFPRQKAAQATGLWAMTTVVAPILGPILGGTISDSIGWSWIFFINVPVALGAGFGVWRMLKSREMPTRKVPVDYTGLGLLIVWVASLEIMLDKGKELDWFSSPTIIGLAVTGAVGFVSFLIWELTAENPIVNLRVFRHRGYVAGVTMTSLAFGAFFASVVLLPLWLQTTMGYTATWAGYAMAFNGILAVIMSPIVGRLIGKFDTRALITFGVSGMGMIALWRSFFTTEFSFWPIALPQLALGFFMVFFFIPGTNLTLSSVRPEETASAAGLSNFLRTTSAAFATSLMTTLWENAATAKRSNLVGNLNNLPGTLDQLARQGFSHDQAIAQVDHLVQNQAVTLATNQMLRATVVVFALAAASAWIAPRPRARAGGPPGGGH